MGPNGGSDDKLRQPRAAMALSSPCPHFHSAVPRRVVGHVRRHLVSQLCTAGQQIPNRPSTPRAGSDRWSCQYVPKARTDSFALRYAMPAIKLSRGGKRARPFMLREEYRETGGVPTEAIVPTSREHVNCALTPPTTRMASVGPLRGVAAWCHRCDCSIDSTCGKVACAFFVVMCADM